MANDNDILIITSSPKPEGVKDSIEKKSGDIPSRVKLTKLTNDTLRRNIALARVDGIVTTLNKELIEIKNAIEQAEAEKAEAEIRKQIIAPVENQPLDEEQLEHMKLTAKVSAASAPSRLLPIFDTSKVELTNISETFYNGQKLVATTVSGYLPKAIMTPKFLAVLCSDIDGKRILYKHADMVKDSVAKPSEEVKVANWRSLFEVDERRLSTDEEHVSEQKQENDFVNDMDSAVTEDELKKRTLIANIGDELDRIDFLLDGIGGNTPFNTGLKEKKSRLLSMLTELTGASVEITKIEKDDLRASKTEFQALIDNIVGYEPPITPEEHKEKESELEHYYSDPYVQEKLEELRLKDILATVNDPEFAAKIDEAERKHNEEIAAKSIAIETLDSIDIVEEQEKKSNEVNNATSIVAESPQETYTKEKIQSMAEEVAQEIYENTRLRSLAAETAQEIYRWSVLRPMAEDAAQEIYREAVLRPMAEDAAQEIYREAELRPIAEDAAQEIYRGTVLRPIAEDVAQETYRGTVLRPMAEDAAQEIYRGTVLRSIAEDAAQETYRGTVLRPMAEDAAQEIYRGTVLRPIAEDAAQEIYRGTVLRPMAEDAAQEIYRETILRPMAEDVAQEIYRGVVNETVINNFNDSNLVANQIREEKSKELQEAVVEQARILASPNKSSDFEVSTSEIGRYGIYVAPSKPIRINVEQLENIRSKDQQYSNNNSIDSKQMLVSLREQLDQLDLGSDDEEFSPISNKAL